MLKVEHLSKMYGKNRGIHDISFTLKPGKILGILGSNGSGKTTTFRILLGLLKQDQGTIMYEHKPVDRANTRLFGYLPEERSLLRDLRVHDQIFYLGRLKDMTPGEIEEQMGYWLNYLDITKYRNRKIVELSKGNQQKVQLVCALIHKPDIYIFDEPLNGLDIENVTLFQQVIRKLQKEKKFIMISSHQYEVIEQFCDSVLYLKEGELLFQGKISSLKRESSATRIIMSETNIDRWIDEAGVRDYFYENGKLTLYMNSLSAGEKLIRRAMKLGLDEYALSLPSLAEIIQERIHE